MKVTRAGMRERVRWRLQRIRVRVSRPLARARLHPRPVDTNFGFNRGRPIDRYYIENFLREERHLIRGRVLEIEHDVYTRRYGEDRVSRCDILHVDPAFGAATIIGDLVDAPHIASDSFECMIVCQTLQFIYDVPAAIRTMHRILKPGGAALVTVPAASRLQAPGCEAEYWRFTSMAAERLFVETFGMAGLRVRTFGNLRTTQAHLAGLAAEDMRQDELDHDDPLYELLVCVRATKQRLQDDSART